MTEYFIENNFTRSKSISVKFLPAKRSTMFTFTIAVRVNQVLYALLSPIMVLRTLYIVHPRPTGKILCHVMNPVVYRTIVVPCGGFTIAFMVTLSVVRGVYYLCWHTAESVKLWRENKTFRVVKRE